jgi:HPt (histidine-containing phosphotransfer) domain-containing protein
MRYSTYGIFYDVVFRRMPELNQQVIEESKEVMQDSFVTMVQYFLEDVVKDINKIQEGVTEQDLEKIISSSHTIKSSSKLLGAERLSNSALAIESRALEIQKSKSSDISDIPPLLVQLQNAYKDAEPELKALLKAN